MIKSTQNPLSEFSGCHVGIIENIKKLAELPQLLKKDGSGKEIEKTAGELRLFFRKVILKHHKDEEETLFWAIREVMDKHLSDAFVLAGHIGRLTEEHRHLERLWNIIDSDLKRLEKGKTVELNIPVLQQLNQDYLAHAEFEEQVFLPLSEKVLSQHDKAGLGMMLHMRETEPNHRNYI